MDQHLKSPVGAKDLTRMANLLCRSIPPAVGGDASLRGSHVLYILGEYERLRLSKFFLPLPPSKRGILVSRLENSGTALWLMYLGAKILRALSESSSSNVVQPYVHWIDKFDQQATSLCQNASVDDLGNRFTALIELSFLKFVVVGYAAGYSVLRRSAPMFFQLFAADPSLWFEQNGRLLISLSRALSAERYEIRRFVFYDTMLALVLGLPPLVEYDSSEFPIISELVEPLDGVHGVPIELIVNIVQVNAWRAAHLGVPNADGWMGLEVRTLTWDPRTEEIQGGDSYEVVTRLAVQESWRHAVLIYIYMGMCGLPSSDFRVQSSVQQIIRLIKLISSASVDIHLFAPCVVVGVAAQYEHQRATVRDKLESFSGIRVWLCRGTDLVPVLDHLWHGVGRDGGAVTWEDYVRSRNVVLPIP
ncbi:hypothetical protein FRC12_000322 [Ceratobasidium sp. 428]|nr:hypothetical protein FRC12_000322 [Ceratobasidium sp. 428]